jgi:hypothetical protein
MMAMLNLIDDSAKLAAQLLSQPHAKEFRDPVGSQSPKADLAAAFENLMDREAALEDEVAAVLNLPDGVEARQVDLFALPLGKLWSQDQRPVVELLLNDLWAKPIGGSLQCCDVLDSQKRIIVLAEGDLGSLEFLLDEGVAIKVVGGLEWQEGSHPHHDRSKYLIVNVEIVVREAAALMRQDPVVGVFCRILRHADPEGRPLFHALEARNTLPHVSASFINWVLAIGCRFGTERVFQGAPLSRNCGFRDAGDPRV